MLAKAKWRRDHAGFELSHFARTPIAGETGHRLRADHSSSIVGLTCSWRGVTSIWQNAMALWIDVLRFRSCGCFNITVGIVLGGGRGVDTVGVGEGQEDFGW